MAPVERLSDRRNRLRDDSSASSSCNRRVGNEGRGNILIAHPGHARFADRNSERDPGTESAATAGEAKAAEAEAHGGRRVVEHMRTADQRPRLRTGCRPARPAPRRPPAVRRSPSPRPRAHRSAAAAFGGGSVGPVQDARRRKSDSAVRGIMVVFVRYKRNAEQATRVVRTRGLQLRSRGSPTAQRMKTSTRRFGGSRTLGPAGTSGCDLGTASRTSSPATAWARLTESPWL
jgi:hypothetical protein